MSSDSHYTFGDTDLARERLRLLAETYDPASVDLLQRWGPRGAAHAIDLGSGPWHTTRLLHRLLAPARTTGLDSSVRYVAQAAADAPPGVSFVQHDVTRLPFPVPPADVLFSRYLLTHLSSPAGALAAWAQASNPGAVLLIQETETLESDAPALARYYALVGELQRRCGQTLYVGRLLDGALRGTPWQIRSSEVRSLAPEPRTMARLHLMNLRTWRRDPVAVEAFDAAELTELEQELASIAEGRLTCPPVRQGLREIVAVRP